MPRHIDLALLAALAACALAGPSRAADGKFEQVRVYLERNLMDKDAEVKFEATGDDSGLSTLKVVAPDGRTVIDFRTPASKLGIRHLSLESPEPKNDGSVQADFPAGVYTFSGSTTGGARLEGRATLSHAFPEAARFLRPAAGAKGVPHRGLQVGWSSVKGLSATVIVIEDEATGREFRANLPGDTTSLIVPDGFLNPGTEYKLAIGTVGKDGNASFIETAFTTAATK